MCFPAQMYGSQTFLTLLSFFLFHSRHQLRSTSDTFSGSRQPPLFYCRSIFLALSLSFSLFHSSPLLLSLTQALSYSLSSFFFLPLLLSVIVLNPSQLLHQTSLQCPCFLCSGTQLMFPNHITASLSLWSHSTPLHLSKARGHNMRIQLHTVSSTCEPLPNARSVAS